MPAVPDEETEVETPEAPVEDETEEVEEPDETTEEEETEEPAETVEAPAATVQPVTKRPPQDEAVKRVQAQKDREIAGLRAQLRQRDEEKITAAIEQTAAGFETHERQRLVTAGYAEDDARNIARDRADLARQRMTTERTQQVARAEIVEQAKILTASDIARRFKLPDATALHQYGSPQEMELAAENMQLKAQTVAAKRAKVTPKSPENRFDGAISGTGSVPSYQRDLKRYNEGARDKQAMAAVERLMQGE